ATETAIRGHIDREEPANFPAVQELLAAHPDAFGTDAALSSLFTLWGARYQPGQDTGCNQVRGQGLDCLFQRGSWRSLVTLNLPAVLSLSDDQGNGYQVVLASIGDQYAELLVEDQLTKVGLLDLSSYWDGEFLLIWRPLAVGAPDIVPGYRGAEIPVLRDALERVDGQADSVADPELFDERLAQRVRDFQQKHRLEPDAIVGARTQIVLNLVSGTSSGPRLTGEQ
ncbi:MAG: peptidoglycan-binding protein, partial [Chromatiales bacterium]|nr:peptidoglycan-binding protein [Chromatiales bacterium]